jgi:hypothetical protein
MFPSIRRDGVGFEPAVSHTFHRQSYRSSLLPFFRKRRNICCAVSAFRFKEKGLTTVEAPFTFEPIGVAMQAGDSLLVNR